jgi:hypothetical protein
VNVLVIYAFSTSFKSALSHGRINQNDRVGQVLDQLLDPFLELHRIYVRRVVQAKEMGPGFTRALNRRSKNAKASPISI